MSKYDKVTYLLLGKKIRCKIESMHSGTSSFSTLIEYQNPFHVLKILPAYLAKHIEAGEMTNFVVSGVGSTDIEGISGVER
jgi:hypothetical protein